MAIYGRGERGLGLALELTQWTRDLVLCTDGPCELDLEDRAQLGTHGIAIREDPIARLDGKDGILEHVVFASGDRLARRALFFTTGQFQRSICQSGSDASSTRRARFAQGIESTHLSGLYVAGDASRAVQWVIVAAARGPKLPSPSTPI